MAFLSFPPLARPPVRPAGSGFRSVCPLREEGAGPGGAQQVCLLGPNFFFFCSLVDVTDEKGAPGWGKRRRSWWLLRTTPPPRPGEGKGGWHNGLDGGLVGGNAELDCLLLVRGRWRRWQNQAPFPRSWRLGSRWELRTKYSAPQIKGRQKAGETVERGKVDRRFVSFGSPFVLDLLGLAVLRCHLSDIICSKRYLSRERNGAAIGWPGSTCWVTTKILPKSVPCCVGHHQAGRVSGTRRWSSVWTNKLLRLRGSGNGEARETLAAIDGES